MNSNDNNNHTYPSAIRQFITYLRAADEWLVISRVTRLHWCLVDGATI